MCRHPDPFQQDSDELDGPVFNWIDITSDGTSTPETFQAILNVDGSVVFQYALVEGSMEGGPQIAVWNGKTDGGNGVSSGRYVARLVVDGVHHVEVLALVR